MEIRAWNINSRFNRCEIALRKNPVKNIFMFSAMLRDGTLLIYFGPVLITLQMWTIRIVKD